MQAYALESWESFFLAIAGAAAALTGLVFVALSINLARILDLPGLPGRAAETIAMLTEVLIVGVVGLVPQEADAFALQLLTVALLGWLVPLWNQMREARRLRLPKADNRGGRRWLILRMSLAQLATIPPIVAAVSVLAGVGGGLYWLVPGVVLLLVNAILNAWVLLVEILR